MSAPTAEADGGARPDLRMPLALWGGMTALLLVLQFVSAQLLRGGDLYLRGAGLRYYLGSWSQFDGPEYLEIATQGYSYTAGERSNIVWFPSYPLLVRWISELVQPPLVAGVVVALVAGALAAVAYWRWLSLQGMTGSARTCAFLALGLYPYAWYLYGVVHSDALFLFLTVSAFTLVQRDRLLVAGLVGALATATRPTGMALLVALVVAGLQRTGVLIVPADAQGLVARLAAPVRVDLSRLRLRSLAPGLCVLGVGGYATYLWLTWGHPLLFITNQTTYHPGDKPLLKLAFLARWRDIADDPTYTITITGQALCALIAILTVPAVARRFGFPIGLFQATLVAIPTVSTEDFMGTGRYLIAAFPAFALLGERLASRSRTTQVAVLGASGALMVFLSTQFARSVYLT